MNNTDYIYTDHAFDLQNTVEYKLLVELSSSVIKFAITHHNNLILLIEATPSDLHHNQHINNILTAKYATTIIGISAVNFTLIPNSLYTDEAVGITAKFLNVGTDELALAQGLDKDNHIIYKTSHQLIEFAKTIPNGQIVFTHKGWIKAIIDNHQSEECLYADVKGNEAHFLQLVSGKIKYYNQFHFDTPDELVYYTALVCNQLNLPQNTIIKWSGNIEKSSDNLTKVKDFFENATVNELTVAGIPQEIPPHQVLSITALLLCE